MILNSLTRPQGMEIVFSEDLFLPEIPVEERAKHWVLIFSTFDDNDKKALQAILSQKQRWAQLLKDLVGYFGIEDSGFLFDIFWS